GHRAPKVSCAGRAQTAAAKARTHAREPSPGLAAGAADTDRPGGPLHRGAEAKGQGPCAPARGHRRLAEPRLQELRDLRHPAFLAGDRRLRAGLARTLPPAELRRPRRLRRTAAQPLRAAARPRGPQLPGPGLQARVEIEAALLPQPALVEPVGLEPEAGQAVLGIRTREQAS